MAPQGGSIPGAECPGRPALVRCRGGGPPAAAGPPGRPALGEQRTGVPLAIRHHPGADGDGDSDGDGLLTETGMLTLPCTHRCTHTRCICKPPSAGSSLCIKEVSPFLVWPQHSHLHGQEGVWEFALFIGHSFYLSQTSLRLIPISQI